MASYRGRYINLDRDTGRRAQLEGQLARLGVADRYERFPAVLGAERSERPDIANRAEVGCFLSHLGAIGGEAGGAWVHVIEDDALLSRYAPSAIDVLAANPSFGVNDIILTNILFPTECWIVPELSARFDRNVSLGPSGEVLSIHGLETVSLWNVAFESAVSYLVNPASAARVHEVLLAEFHRSPFLPFDTAMARATREGRLSVSCVVPFLTVVDMSTPSNIRDAPNRARLARWLMEASLFADRDPARLRSLIAGMTGAGQVSATAELMTSAFRASFAGSVEDSMAGVLAG